MSRAQRHAHHAARCQIMHLHFFLAVAVASLPWADGDECPDSDLRRITITSGTCPRIIPGPPNNIHTFSTVTVPPPPTGPLGMYLASNDDGMSSGVWVTGYKKLAFAIASSHASHVRSTGFTAAGMGFPMGSLKGRWTRTASWRLKPAAS